jgi:pimeloyl-ACP methyl ester carboxylesterase
MMRGAIWLLLFWLAACAVPDRYNTSDPMLFDAGALERADSAVIGVPGAFTSIKVLAPIDDFATPTRAVVYYRLPGFDGRPEDEWVVIDRAAARIAKLVRDAALSRVDLIGHSTGAVIALEAAKEIRRTAPNVDVSVTAISSALPAPQPILAGVRGAAGTLAAATRARSLDPRTVWLEYYRRLAYGPQADATPAGIRAADALVAANDDRIELPDRGLGRRHTRALRRWTNPDPGAAAGARLTYYHGAVDPVFPPRLTKRFTDTLPGANLRLIKGHGHLLLLTYPEIWTLIGDDLKR